MCMSFQQEQETSQAAQKLGHATVAGLSAVLPQESFISPLSIQLALALVGCGATGQTLQEFQNAMGWPQGQGWQERLANALNVFYGLADASVNADPTLIVAVRVFIRRELRVKQDYVALISDRLHAGICPLESAGQVNKFVAETTRNKITDIVTDSMIASSPMVAVSAVYFKGSWEKAFDKSLTKPHRFASVNGDRSCNMMFREKQFKYHEDEKGTQYVLLPYRWHTPATALSALVVLPRATVTGSALLGVNVPEVVATLMRGDTTHGKVLLPRFKAEASMDLKDSLQRVGLQRAFADAAEFPHIADAPLKIDGVVHKVMVEIDEEGTVAAAATAVFMGFGCLVSEPVRTFEMRCDRPFGFCVVHEKTGLPLFTGTVTADAVGTASGPPPPAAVGTAFGPPSTLPGFTPFGPRDTSAPAQPQPQPQPGTQGAYFAPYPPQPQPQPQP
eukprot:Hpha_TRINITY_DN14867_c0_g1::TRINITY_DN14867_c0_g1_i1::g.168944::m.168944/K13963/SERPINB; serpin B